MADLTEQLVAGSYRATKRPSFETEVVRMDGGATHRNSRWATPLAQWDVEIPPCKRSSAQYLAAVALFEAALGSGRTFTFHDPVACADVEAVILEDTMTISPLGNLVEIAFAVEQYR